MRDKGVFVDVAAKYADHLGFNRGLPPPDCKSKEFQLKCFTLLPEASKDQAVVTYTHVRFCIGAEVQLPSLIKVTSEWTIDHNEYLAMASVSHGSVTLKFMSLFPHLEELVRETAFMEFVTGMTKPQDVPPSVVLHRSVR